VARTAAATRTAKADGRERLKDDEDAAARHLVRLDVGIESLRVAADVIGRMSRYKFSRRRSWCRC
jgi:hypothetical protein